MNILCTDPHAVVDPKILEQYFEDARNGSFDIACNAYSSYAHDELVGSLAPSYTRFAFEARRRGCPACIRIQVSHSRGDAVGTSEAQYKSDNTPELTGGQGFFASFASTQWMEYLKTAINLFIQDYGYNWVLLDPPIYRVDIPGTKDRFYRTFIHRYPEVKYPEAASETSAYLKVQKLKADLAIDFYAELSGYAKSIGAEKVGIVLNRFSPSPTTSSKTMNDSHIDNGRLTIIKDIDFTVVPVPEVIVGTTKSGKKVSHPYSEIISQCCGKPVIMEIDHTEARGPNTKRKPAAEKASPAPTICSIAAIPNGISTDWAHQSEDKNVIQDQWVRTANRLLPKLNRQAAPIAVVFSASGGRHCAPNTYDDVWQFYSSITNHILFDEKAPVLTFTADALEVQLKTNPQVNMLILEEHFPLTSEQMSTVIEWWKAEPGRAILAVGSGLGFSANPDKPGAQPLSEAFPGLLKHIGIEQLDPPTVGVKGGVVTLKAGIGPKPLIPSQGLSIDVSQIANVRRVFGSGARQIYSDQHSRPLITEWISGRTAAYFCGIGASDATASLIMEIIRYAFRSTHRPKPPITSSSEFVIWNGSADGYLVVANCSDEPAQATVFVKPYAYWDIINKELVRDTNPETTIAPRSFRFLRRMAKRSKFYDVSDAVHVESIVDGAGRADITLTTGVDTAFVVRSLPKEVLVDDLTTDIKVENYDGYSKIYIPEIDPGDYVVTLRW